MKERRFDMKDMIEVTEFLEYVQRRGYKALALLNTTGVGEGKDMQINAYELRGPRGNRKVVIKDKDGLLSLFDAQLWCDGVDYATQRIRRA